MTRLRGGQRQQDLSMLRQVETRALYPVVALPARLLSARGVEFQALAIAELRRRNDQLIRQHAFQHRRRRQR